MFFFPLKRNDGQLGNYIPPPPPLTYIPPPPPLTLAQQGVNTGRGTPNNSTFGNSTNVISYLNSLLPPPPLPNKFQPGKIPPPPPLPQKFQPGYIPPPPPLPDKFKNPPPEDDWIKKTFGDIDKSVLLLGGLALVLVLTGNKSKS